MYSLKKKHTVQGLDLQRQESAAAYVWGITRVSKDRWEFEDKASI